MWCDYVLFLSSCFYFALSHNDYFCSHLVWNWHLAIIFARVCCVYDCAREHIFFLFLSQIRLHQTCDSLKCWNGEKELICKVSTASIEYGWFFYCIRNVINMTGCHKWPACAMNSSIFTRIQSYTVKAFAIPFNI